MKDVARVKLFEADHFIEDAENRLGQDDEFSPSVAVGHAMDAVILAVGVLCHVANRPPPRRHDDGPKVFLELIKGGSVPAEASQWRELLKTTASRGTAIQYRAEVTSATDARRYVRDAAAFVRFVRSAVRPL